MRMNIKQQLTQAMLCQQRGDLEQAKSLYEAILRQQPRQADALHYLGTLALQAQQYQEAIDWIEKAITLQPKRAQFYSNASLALQKLGRITDAIRYCRKALHYDNTLASAHYNLGLALRLQGDLHGALSAFDKAIQHELTATADAYNNRGATQALLGKTDAAIIDYYHALSLNPQSAHTHLNLSQAFCEQGEFDRALWHCNQAIALNAQLEEAYLQRAIALNGLQRHNEADDNLNRVQELSPSNAEVCTLLISQLIDSNRLEDAFTFCEQNITKNPQSPTLYAQCGLVLTLMGRFTEAMIHHEQAFALIHEQPSAQDMCHYTYGVSLYYMGNMPQAIANFRLAPEKSSTNVAMRQRALSYALLADGQFAEGWQLYETRWQMDDLKKARPTFLKDQPSWLGETPLMGKTLLLWSEQGLGDTLQFCRYAPLLAKQGATVLLGVPESLVTIMHSLDGVHKVVTETTPFDYHCPVASLPLVCKTFSEADIPTHIPYLSAPDAKIRQWQKRLGKRCRLRVGLVWSGGFRANQPHLWATDKRRNMPLEQLAILQDLPCDFYSLQKGEPYETDLCLHKERYWQHDNLFNFSDKLQDISDTAALMMHLDLIISVDTAMVHLAGALGKPVWMLNRFDSCWRWLIGREDSLWYPTMKIYRQSQWNDWDTVLQRVKTDLQTLAS